MSVCDRQEARSRGQVGERCVGVTAGRADGAARAGGACGGTVPGGRRGSVGGKGQGSF